MVENIKIYAHVIRLKFIELNKNWFIGTTLKFTLLFILLSIVILLLKWKELPPLVPLWYAKPWGQDRLASSWYLWILPAGSTMWLMGNTMLAMYIAREYFVFSQLLFLVSGIISLMSLVTLVKIIFLTT